METGSNLEHPLQEEQTSTQRNTRNTEIGEIESNDKSMIFPSVKGSLNS